MKPRSGQAVMEYILMLLIAISMVGAVSIGFRRIVQGVWQEMACEITAPCPNCPAPPQVKNKIAPQACKN